MADYEILGWLPWGDDAQWRDGPPVFIQDEEIAAVRMFGPDPAGEGERFFTVMGPFEFAEYDDFLDYLDDWAVEAYGVAAE